MLRVLLQRLCQAQRFDSYVDGHFSQDTEAIRKAAVKAAVKAANSSPGGRTVVTLHRCYGKHPQERSSSVWVRLPVAFKGNYLALDPTADIRVETSVHGGPRPPKQANTPVLNTTHIRPTSLRTTWLRILHAIDQIREPRKRKVS